MFEITYAIKSKINNIHNIWQKMFTNLALVIQFYWKGKIVEIRGSFAYDIPRCKKVILVRGQIVYDELVDRVYTYMGLDRTTFNLNLWF